MPHHHFHFVNRVRINTDDHDFIISSNIDDMTKFSNRGLLVFIKWCNNSVKPSLSYCFEVEKHWWNKLPSHTHSVKNRCQRYTFSIQNTNNLFLVWIFRGITMVLHWEWNVREHWHLVCGLFKPKEVHSRKFILYICILNTLWKRMKIL